MGASENSGNAYNADPSPFSPAAGNGFSGGFERDTNRAAEFGFDMGDSGDGHSDDYLKSDYRNGGGRRGGNRSGNRGGTNGGNYRGNRGSNHGNDHNGGKRTLTRKQIILIVVAAVLVLCLIAQCSGNSSNTASTQSSTSAFPSVTATPSASSSSAAPSQAASPSDSATASPSQSTTDQASGTGSGDLAQTVLNELPVQARASKDGYARDQFGQAWSDVDHNGCDTRNDILKRDLTNLTFKANTHDCVVASGTLNDPYTGKTIAFVRGQETSNAVQIDHVVALSNAWQTGAQNLTADQRLQLANDPYNLLAVDGPANQEKSDSDAASWLPPNTAFDCEYVARQIGVKHKYALWVTSGEKSAMQTVLSTCPSQTVPTEGGVQGGSAAGSGTSGSGSSDSAQAANSSANSAAQSSGNAAANTSGDSASQSDASGTVTYSSCAAVRAAGKAPLYKGQPGYSEKLDRDNDGIACEK
ncbi:MAG: excalibur calcium-binding domain-containing protein [Bifidobacteriaceae bacterium]|nr:excalibur calcium-binding domain-containing protein [Bifidobacteriaceae bacterium]